VALNAKGDVEGAISSHREAIRLGPEHAQVHTNLGYALHGKGDVEGAIRSWRQAIRIDPKHVQAHTNLGVALLDKGDVEGAISSHREAIRLDPKHAKAHTGLGLALLAKGDVEGAIRSLREAIRLDPKLGNAHGALGRALMAYGDFASAHTALQQAAKLFPPTHPLSRTVAHHLAQCRQLLDRERTLHAFLAGKHTPKGPAERVALAGIAVLPAKQRYATSARMYTKALQSQPALADDLRAGHRYNAACAAARAGTGQGKDAAKLDDTQRAEMRYRALCWLQDDLAAHTRALGRSWAIWGKRSYQALLHWQKDADLAAVRDAHSLAKLPEPEQVAWRNLWAQVDTLLATRKGGK
jgi:Flp pilus assembly protein TadD